MIVYPSLNDVINIQFATPAKNIISRRLTYCSKCQMLGISNIKLNTALELFDDYPIFFSAYKRRNEPPVTIYSFRFIGTGIGFGLSECQHKKEIVCAIGDELPGSLDKCMGCSLHYRCLFFMSQDEWNRFIGATE